MIPKYNENVNPAALRLLEQHIKATQQNKLCTILEYGCNTGAFGAHILSKYSSYDLSWTGLDVNQRSLEIAKNRLSFVKQADLNLISVKQLKDTTQNTPEIIIMIDVLEHLVDPHKLLFKTLSAFPTSKCIVVLPNIGCLSILQMLAMNEFEYQESGILDNTHLKHFTSISAKRMFNSTGYNIEIGPLWLFEPEFAHLSETVENYPHQIKSNNISISVTNQESLFSLISYGHAYSITPQ